MLIELPILSMTREFRERKKKGWESFTVYLTPINTCRNGYVNVYGDHISPTNRSVEFLS